MKSYLPTETIALKKKLESSDENKKTVMISDIGQVHLVTDTADVEVHFYDSPGYGDHIDNQKSFNLIRRDLINRHEEWRKLPGQMVTEQDRQASDSRIHCVFYFMSPHRMKDIDSNFIKLLCDLVPIVPVVAKADAMTSEERETFLRQVSVIFTNLEKEIRTPVLYDFEETFPHSEESGEPFVGLDHFSLESSSQIEDNYHSTHDPKIKPAKYVSDDICSEVSSMHMSHGVGDALKRTVTSGIFTDDENIDPNLHVHTSPHELKSNTSISIRRKLYRVPNIFAVIASVNRVRNYPWGSIKIDDDSVSDFYRLRSLIFGKGKILFISYHIN